MESYASRLLPPSFLSTSTIAAACARRTISGVIAIRACLRGEDPERKRSRQLQRGFEAAAGTLSHDPAVRRRGLGTRTIDCFRGDARALWCRQPGGCGSQRRGRTRLSRALPLAEFPHPRCSLCWIAIGHTFAQMRAPCTVHPQKVWGMNHSFKPLPGVRFLSKS